jgi:hypothetical protein
MRISIKLNAQAASELNGHAQTAESTRSLIETARQHGAALQPMHAGTTDPELGTYFYADVDDEKAGSLTEALRAHEAVEGAYVKPPDALP